MALSTLSWLVGLMNHIHILSRPIDRQGRREPIKITAFFSIIEFWLTFRHFEPNFYQTWYDRYHYTLYFDASLKELDLLLRSQIYEKAELLH